MTWIDYVEKKDWQDGKILLLELTSKENGAKKYQVATIYDGKIRVIGGHFYFDVVESYSITKYCLINKPMNNLMSFSEYVESRNNFRDPFYTSWADEYEGYVYRNECNSETDGAEILTDDLD